MKLLNLFKKKKPKKEDSAMTEDEKQIEKAKEDIADKGADSQTKKDRIDESVGEQERRDGDENSQNAKDRVDESEDAKKADEKRAEEKADSKAAESSKGSGDKAYVTKEEFKQVATELAEIKETLKTLAQSHKTPTRADDETAAKLKRVTGLYEN